MKNKMRGHYNWTEADKWILANFKLGWKEFQKEFPQFPFTDATFYNRKYKLVKGKDVPQATKTTRVYKTLYQTLLTIPRTEVTDSELKGMIRMNEIITKHTNEKIEIIQVVKDEIPQIEIREIQTR